MNIKFQRIKKGICAPEGFKASGIYAGIKKDPHLLDLALIYCEQPCAWAACFTQHPFRAAPVKICQSLLKAAKPIQALIINSGNANACTGKEGEKTAKKIVKETAKLLHIPLSSVLPFSTGVIGVPLDEKKITSHLKTSVEKLSSSGGANALKAIQTTDRIKKEAAWRITTPAGSFTIGVIAKGAGMIHPNMATMLSFITTDLNVSTKNLQKALNRANQRTFSRITVDGDTSTNDSLILLSSGKKKLPWKQIHKAFEEAIEKAACEMALLMVKDGEGATRMAKITVHGANSEAEAQKAAQGIATSVLFKCALFGADPNWGRIIAALGNSGIALDPKKITIQIDSQKVFQKEKPVKLSPKSLTALEKKMKKKFVPILIELGKGKGKGFYYTSDLSYEYVKINAEYTT